MENYQKDIPILQEVVNGTWSKEARLSELKTELAAIDRKIQLSIEPKQTEQQETPAEKFEEKQEVPKVSDIIIRTKGVHLSRGVL